MFNRREFKRNQLSASYCTSGPFGICSDRDDPPKHEKIREETPKHSQKTLLPLVESMGLNGHAPRFDARNRLNDLSNVEWLTFTKSVWQSRPPPRDQLKEQHPATFAESDVEKLILFFTKKGGLVLDPFVGSGSTLIACLNTGRRGYGVELVNRWVAVARKRVEQAKEKRQQSDAKGLELEVLPGDARVVLGSFESEFFDFVVTSPPYWRILTKASDHKSKRERLSKGLPTQYSNDDRDLGNAPDYEFFLSQLASVFAECYRVLKSGKYMVVIVSDFRHGSRFIPYHNDMAAVVQGVGFALEGITVLVQDSKNLYPYGMPYAFVSNIHHQYILIFRKPAASTADKKRVRRRSLAN
jgi:DNA modification methylase